jgi:hypothetical protein
VPSFTVTAAGQKVQLDGTGAAQAQYTVTNTSVDELSGRLLATPQDPAKGEWFTIDGEATREFAPAAAEQVRLQIKVPAGTPPATYSVRLDAVSEVNPDEDFTEGPSVAFDVTLPKPPVPWWKRFWWIFVIAGVVLLAIIGVVVWLLVRGNSNTTTTNTTTTTNVNVVSQGQTAIKGTWLWDAESGQLTGQGDVWWEQETDVLRQMVPRGTATIANLGFVNFDSVTAQSLAAAPYTSIPIDGNDDGSNQLATGDVFAIHTDAGNYAKVLVTSYGYDLGIQWVTYQLGP